MSPPELLAVAVSDEHAALVATLASTVAAVVAAIYWIDARIVARIREHNAEEELRHRAIVAEIRSLMTAHRKD